MRLCFSIAAFFVCAAVAIAAPNPWPNPDERGVRFGAYMDFGESEDAVTLEGIEKFEKLAGKRPALIASSSYWGEQSFPAANLRLIDRHGAVPLIFWSPWDKPYEQNKGPDRFGLTEILGGKWDDYIKVKEGVCRLIRFERFNLLKDTPNTTKQFDVVF